MRRTNIIVAGWLLIAGFAQLFIAGAMNDSGAPIWLVIMVGVIATLYLIVGLMILKLVTKDKEDDASRTLRK